MIMTPSTAFENSLFFQIWKASHQEMGLSGYVDKEVLEALYWKCVLIIAGCLNTNWQWKESYPHLLWKSLFFKLNLS